MATRYGWTFNGHHYTTCESVRMGNPLTSYHRDGVKMTESEWRREMKKDREIEKNETIKQ